MTSLFEGANTTSTSGYDWQVMLQDSPRDRIFPENTINARIPGLSGNTGETAVRGPFLRGTQEDSRRLAGICYRWAHVPSHIFCEERVFLRKSTSQKFLPSSNMSSAHISQFEF
jgi:hypothetical protein